MEQKRQTLATMLVTLKELQEAAGVMSLASGIEPFVENEGEFDEVSESASASATSGTSDSNLSGSNIKLVERQVLTMASNRNVLGDLRELEIRHRIQQAHREVERLRDIVADISFQYSHVVRGAIRKSIRTTAQKRVKSLHRDLVLHARIYTRCRSRLLALDCDQRLLQIFRVLTRADLKASTAILTPNIPGSSGLQLSWIWQTGRWHLLTAGDDPDPDPDRSPDTDPEASPASLLECESYTAERLCHC